MINVNHVSLCYRMPAERISGMKEFLVRVLQGKLQYKEFWALQDVDFSIEKGEVLGLVGAGGIGAPLIFAMNKYDWSRAGAILLGLILLVWMVDVVSGKLAQT